MVKVCSSLWETAKLSSKLAVLVCLPNTSGWELLFHIFVSIWYQCFGFWPFLQVYSSIQFCFSLYFSDHIWCKAFFYMLIFHLWILVSCLFRSFAIFKLSYLFTYGLVLQQSKFTNLQVPCIFSVIILYLCLFCKHFLPVCDFLFSWQCLSETRILNF